MAMDGLPEGFLLPAGWGQLLQAAPILKRRWRRYREENGNSRSILWVSSSGGKYRRRGHREGPQGSQEAPWRDLGWGRARDPSGVPVVAPLSSFGVSGGFRDADFLYNFAGIFGALLMAENLKYKNSRKQELAT